VTSQCREKFVMHTTPSPELFCRALNTALRAAQWQDTFVDRDMRTMVAHQKHDQQIGGKHWSYRLSTTIAWQQDAGSVSGFDISVSEANFDWSAAQCQEQMDKLLGAIDSAVIRAANGDTARGARWAGVDELIGAGYIGDLSGRQLIIGVDDENRFIRLPESDTNRHAIVCGPTGTGKTTSVFIPNLIERTASCALVTEATGGRGLGDLFEKTSGYRQAAGHKIFYFNPEAPNSHRINPMDNVRTYRQARRICEIIMQSTTLRTHRGDQSWELSERMLLTGLILHAAGERNRGRCHLGYVNEMLNGGISGLKTIMAGTQVEEADICFNRFAKSTTDSYRNLVMNGVMNRLDAWNTPQVVAATSQTDMDWKDLTQSLWTIYLAVPAAQSEMKPLMALIFNDLIEFIMANQFKHPPMLMLDEFTNFGFVGGLPEKLTILRHDKLPVVLGVQDYIQLELRYDREAKLLVSQPGTRIFFRPNDLETAQKICAMLGEAITEGTRLSSNGQLHEKEKKEPLLSPDSLLNLSPVSTACGASLPTMIAMLPGTRPVQVAAFHWSEYAHFADAAAFPLPIIPPLEAAPLLTPRYPTKKPVDIDEGADVTRGRVRDEKADDNFDEAALDDHTFEKLENY
jgi:type IV secretory pathway TraG/TraD family ATPase VirD4